MGINYSFPPGQAPTPGNKLKQVGGKTKKGKK